MVSHGLMLHSPSLLQVQISGDLGSALMKHKAAGYAGHPTHPCQRAWLIPQHVLHRTHGLLSTPLSVLIVHLVSAGIPTRTFPNAPYCPGTLHGPQDVSGLHGHAGPAGKNVECGAHASSLHSTPLWGCWDGIAIQPYA